jgi:hypothetical protein
MFEIFPNQNELISQGQSGLEITALASDTIDLPNVMKALHVIAGTGEFHVMGKDGVWVPHYGSPGATIPFMARRLKASNLPVGMRITGYTA